MKAVILAAGKGSRLSRTSPKPLTLFLGLTLIERTILSAKFHGITDFVVVVGYRGKEVIDYLNKKELGVHIQYVNNSEWEKENGLSALRAKEVVGREDFILIMVDHVFDPEILGTLLHSAKRQCTLLIDRNLNHIFDLRDATKVFMEGKVPRNIGKDIEKYNAVDCGVFYCTSEMFEALEACVSAGKYRLSDAAQYLIAHKKLDVVDIEGRYWYDIDTPDALKHAEKSMLRSLTKPTDGPISRHLNRKISTRISALLVRTNITPNQLSLCVFIISALASLLFFTMHNYLSLVGGGLLVQISSILDGCDGEVARLKFMQSRSGGFLDAVLDRYADALIILGLCYGWYLFTGNSMVWLVGCGAIIGSLLFSYTNARYEAVFEGKDGHSLPIRRDVRLFIVMLGALTMQVFASLSILTIMTNIEVMRRMITFTPPPT